MTRALHTLAHATALAVAACALAACLAAFATTVAIGAPVALAFIMGRI